MSATLKYLDSDGATQITGYDFGVLDGGTSSPKRKFGIENTSDRVLAGVHLSVVPDATSDAPGMTLFAADTNTVSHPFGLLTSISSTGSGGVWDAPGNIYYVITAINGTGETGPSGEVLAVVAADSQKVTLTWTLPTGATGIKVFRTVISGDYTTPSLRATLGAVSTYQDDGSALSSGAPPSANTTAGAGPVYGTAPTLGASPVSVGSLAIGQQWFYWANEVVPIGTLEAGNDRLANLQFMES
jgi:hypothetical protein